MRSSQATTPQTQWFTLPGHYSWEQFQALDQLLNANQRGVRIFYLDGVIELMSISAQHELIKSILDALLVLFFCHHQLDAVPMGSATLQSADQSMSAEPDLSYRFDGVIGLPELAIEVALSSGGIEKLARYQRLQIPEVWFWQDERLWLYGWQGEDYEALDESRILKGIDIDAIETGVRTGNLLQATRLFSSSG
jgi:Uma2 family endonuclease